MGSDDLKRVLWINALFSTVSAIVLVAAAGGLSTLFGGASPWIFRGIGVGLLLFAVDIAVSCRQPRIARGKALYFSLSDFGWVVGTAVLLIAVPLPAAAVAVVVAVGLAVLALGVAQYRLLRRMPSHTG
jgi:hypothetical protein